MLPNTFPVTEPETFNEPVTVNEPEIIAEPVNGNGLLAGANEADKA